MTYGASLFWRTVERTANSHIRPSAVESSLSGIRSMTSDGTHVTEACSNGKFRSDCVRTMRPYAELNVFGRAMNHFAHALASLPGKWNGACARESSHNLPISDNLLIRLARKLVGLIRGFGKANLERMDRLAQTPSNS